MADQIDQPYPSRDVTEYAKEKYNKGPAAKFTQNIPTDQPILIVGLATTTLGTAAQRRAPGTNATAVKDTTGGGLIDVDGSVFDIDNVTWTDADLDVAEATPIASNCTVSGSDASAGTEIDATDNCTDNGSNTNWAFASTVIPHFLFEKTAKQKWYLGV